MTRQGVIDRITHVRNWLAESGYEGMASDLTGVLTTFSTMESRAGAILGAKGGKIGGKAKTEAKTLANRANANLPPKEGKKPRGRPRKPKLD